MTTPAAIQSSQLVKTLTLLYSMQEADTVDMATRLQAQRVSEWKLSVSQELRRYGCAQTGQAPAGSDAEALSQLSLADARSIAQTYNRELGNQVQRLYTANPRGNRNYYYKALEAWSAKRDGYKAGQIALQTAATTRSMAQTRFRAMNGIDKSRFVFSGAPPVCIRCLRLKAKGIVGIEVVRANPTPIHQNCPHEFVDIRPLRSKLDCSTVWTGA